MLYSVIMLESGAKDYWDGGTRISQLEMWDEKYLELRLWGYKVTGPNVTMGVGS